VEGDSGRFWGRFGAAGLLAHDPARGILLQHRVDWSDQGGTWGLPGGARHEHEDAVSGALREAREEAGVPAGHVAVRFVHVLDHEYWTYTTVAVRVLEPFEAVISDPESVELRWVPLDEVGRFPLHSGFAAAWPVLRRQLERPSTVVLDAANIVGSRPDGWWRDRTGAARRLLDRVDGVARAGVPAAALEVPLSRVWPCLTVVLEGAAKAAAPADENSSEGNSPPAGRVGPQGGAYRDPRTIVPPAGRVAPQGGAYRDFGAIVPPAGRVAPHGGAYRDPRTRVILAPGSGDDAIVEATAELAQASAVTVVTADRGLRSRVEPLGARVVGPSWFWELADAVD